MWLRVWLAVLVLAVGVRTHARAQPVSAEAKQAVLDELEQVLIRRAYVGGVNFSALGKHLKYRREDLERAQSAGPFAHAVNEALEQFGISHVRLLTPRGQVQRTQSTVVGIGIAARQADAGLRVLSILPNTPAAASGLAAGDLILSIDGKKPEAPDDLGGEEGTTATLRVRKLGGGVVEIAIVRAEFKPANPPQLTRIGDDAALIRIPTFGERYEEREVEDLFTQALDSPLLVLDLRGNGGGKVTNLRHLLSFMLIADTPIGTAVSNEVAARFVEATGGDPGDVKAVAAWSTRRIRVPDNPIRPYPGRLAVLIDGQSASASEMAAAALRELRKATIVGRTSAGALLVSTYVPLPDGFAAQVPISDYVTIKGFRPEGEGVKPDVDAPQRRRRGEDDPGLAAALQALRGL